MGSYIFFCIFSPLLVASTFVINPGPKYPPTEGEVWPAPSLEKKTKSYFICDAKNLKFKKASLSCDILDKALKRYKEIIVILHENATKGIAEPRKNVCRHDCTEEGKHFLGYLHNFHIYLNKPCEEYPQANMDEKYTLTIDLTSTLRSDSIWGILRGLETFSQLLYISKNTNDVWINKTHITDHPRYPHRGLMLDTSQHFISLDTILEILDGMAMNKMNVFHWHIVDDPSFPYQSERFPELSKKGAFNSSMTYTKQDIHFVVNYARDHAIRVVPEFDVPGHTASWGAAYPNILTQCYNSNSAPDGLGPMNPINNASYILMKELFNEVQHLFPDKYLHVGGDEVDLNCWNSNPVLRTYMRQHRLSSAIDLHKLFMTNTLALLSNNTIPMVWQDVFDNGVPLSNDTVVQVWKYGDVKEMQRILRLNKKVVFSSAWYLDAYLGLHWQNFYKVDPKVQAGQVENTHNIIGGEAYMWGEEVNDDNVVKMIWPRASAVAERLWTDKVPTGELARELSTIHPYVYNRLEEHTCRMTARGVGAQPTSGAELRTNRCLIFITYVMIQIFVLQ